MNYPVFHPKNINYTGTKLEYANSNGYLQLIVNGAIAVTSPYKYDNDEIRADLLFKAFGYVAERIAESAKVNESIISAFRKNHFPFKKGTNHDNLIIESYIRNLPYGVFDLTNTKHQRAILAGFYYFKKLTNNFSKRKNFDSEYAGKLSFFRGMLDAMSPDEKYVAYEHLELRDVRFKIRKPSADPSMLKKNRPVADQDFQVDENERESFNALTDGSDISYDEWKQQGGDLDSLMDSMGRG